MRPTTSPTAREGLKLLAVRDDPYVLKVLTRILADLDAKAEFVEATATGGDAPRDASPRDLGLTDRQAEVLGCMVQGLPNKLICRRLNISPGTVKNHVSAILRALRVNNRTQAVVTASRLGFRVDGVAG